MKAFFTTLVFTVAVMIALGAGSASQAEDCIPLSEVVESITVDTSVPSLRFCTSRYRTTGQVLEPGEFSRLVGIVYDSADPDVRWGYSVDVADPGVLVTLNIDPAPENRPAYELDREYVIEYFMRGAPHTITVTSPKGLEGEHGSSRLTFSVATYRSPAYMPEVPGAE